MLIQERICRKLKMFLNKYSWKKYLQQSLHLQILIGVLGISFLFLTFYTASFLSSISVEHETQEKKSGPVYVRADFVQVLIVTDKKGVVGTVALVNSILLNTKKPVHFYFLTDASGASELHYWLEKTSFERMSYVIKIFNPKVLGIDLDVVQDASSDESLLRYSMFYITKLLPQARGIVICLSNDAIVQGDIAELEKFKIAKNHFGALSTSCDTLSNVYHKDQSRYAHYINMSSTLIKKASINGDQCIFDMGVMVLNLTLWEKENVTKKLEYWFHLNQKHKVFLMDNVFSSFLIVFYNRTSPLSRSWHVRNLGVTRGSHFSMQYLQNAKLLRWDGHFKPWEHKSAISHLWLRYSITRPKGPDESASN